MRRERVVGASIKEFVVVVSCSAAMGRQGKPGTGRKETSESSERKESKER